MTDEERIAELVEAAVSAERTAIVEWLRGDNPYPDAYDIADEVEAGEHLK